MDFVIQLEPNPLPAPSDGAGQATEPTHERRVQHSEQAPRPDLPKTGLFTQTIVPSPIIQWILPARLRGRHRNDVVFVGERRLQIKEAVSGIHLEDAITKTDFDSNIRAAKVINVGTELPWESQMKLRAGNVTADAETESQANSPPQILLLSLDSRELVFLFYSYLDGGQFIHYHRPLPSDVSSFERFGNKIAVEPRSRAVAVSAPCDYFGVFMLKPPSVLQTQMAQDRLDPVLEERFFRVDGDILFMDFLYPMPEDGGRIILLLLVARDQTTRAVCYDWDANATLRHSTPRIVTRTLPSEYRLPSMLIPSTKSSSFMLATPTSLVMYKNRLDPSMQPIQYPLSIPENGSQRSPLCTQWAKPLRNSLHNQWHDDLYLCREDGTIFYVEIGNEGDVESQFYLGQLGCDVDAAFDVLDIGHEGADLIAAAGSMGDGGLFIQRARDQPQCVQRFTNWSPVTDSVVANCTAQTPLAAGATYDRLFACHASTIGQGDLVELRRGIEAQIGLVVPLEELSSARDIWAMADSVSGGVYILTSDPVSSLLFYLPTDFEEEICAVDESDSGLDFSAHTLAAGCTASGLVIQVTEKAIRLGNGDISHPTARFDYDTGESVAAAAVSGSDSLAITAVRSQKGIHLHLTRVVSSDDQHQPQLLSVGNQVRIDEEPVCILIESFGSAHFIFVGTGDGNVLTYGVNREGLLHRSTTAVAIEKGDDISKAIESLATISIATGGPLMKSTLFCGLRSGFLVPFEVAVDSSNASTIEMKQASPQRLGETPVKLQGRGGFALSTCGESFWQVSCAHEDDPEYTLERVWVTDQNNPAYSLKSIDSFTISNVLDPNLGGLFDSLFCIADGQLLICTLDQTAKTVPRRIFLPGRASRMAYSKLLRSLVVAYTRTELDTESSPIRRFTTPFIEFVDPDSQESVVKPIDTAGDGDSQPWRPQGAAGEKISCIMEWTPENDGQVYHFIVIGTCRKNQQELGRVIFLQASRSSSNPSQIQCSVKYIQKFAGPVHAIAPYGALTLMVSAGNDIIPLDIKSSERGSRISRYSLLSPATSITIREPYLYLSTTRESLVVLKLSNDRLVLHAQGRQKLDGLSHALLGEPDFCITSSRGGRVSVLGETGNTTSDKMLPNALAEAHLPVSVVKLTPGSKPSPVSFSHVVYGTTITGAIYRFLVLNDKEWRLLRLLQNLCVRDRMICPFTPKRKRRNPVDVEALNLSSRMHIDGDILGRLAERDAGYLQLMLATTEFDNPLSPDKGSAAATLQRFAEASEELLGMTTNAAEEVMRWLRRVLQMGF